MPDFSRIIRMAYLRILDREPDPGGLASYNTRMNGGMSEAAMRESLLRSPEYATKNPARLAGAAGRGRGARTASRRPAPTRKKVRSRQTR
ncbi:MAG: hypothetical protein DMF80_13100 [Acidobacteria bacterium]|nr:MAG: hypothetical protein DMF80_13100 [Acidobacteriota bacterium]